jgi:hypothetical protein
LDLLAIHINPYSRSQRVAAGVMLVVDMAGGAFPAAGGGVAKGDIMLKVVEAFSVVS